MNLTDDQKQVLRMKIHSTIMREGPISAINIRKFLKMTKTPMPVFQNIVVAMHIGGIIEKAGYDKQRQVKWRMATK